MWKTRSDNILWKLSWNYWRRSAARWACEGYSLDYVKVEMIWDLSKYDAATENTNKKMVQATNGQY